MALPPNQDPNSWYFGHQKREKIPDPFYGGLDHVIADPAVEDADFFFFKPNEKLILSIDPEKRKIERYHQKLAWMKDRNDFLWFIPDVQRTMNRDLTDLELEFIYKYSWQAKGEDGIELRKKLPHTIFKGLKNGILRFLKHYTNYTTNLNIQGAQGRSELSATSGQSHFTHPFSSNVTPYDPGFTPKRPYGAEVYDVGPWNVKSGEVWNSGQYYYNVNDYMPPEPAPPGKPFDWKAFF